MSKLAREVADSISMVSAHNDTAYVAAELTIKRLTKGKVIVPAEPTEAMLDEIMFTDSCGYDAKTRQYKAMLKASEVEPCIHGVSVDDNCPKCDEVFSRESQQDKTSPACDNAL